MLLSGQAALVMEDGGDVFADPWSVKYGLDFRGMVDQAFLNVALFAYEILVF